MLCLFVGCFIAGGCNVFTEKMTEEKAKREFEKWLVIDNKDHKERRRSEGMETYICYSLKSTSGLKYHPDDPEPYLDYVLNMVERRFADDVVVSEHTKTEREFRVRVYYSTREGKWQFKYMG